MSTRSFNTLLALGALALILMAIAGCDRPPEEVYRDSKRCIDAGMIPEHDHMDGTVICTLPKGAST